MLKNSNYGNSSRFCASLHTRTYVDKQILVHSIGILDHTAISSCWRHGIISPIEADSLVASVPVEIKS